MKGVLSSGAVGNWVLGNEVLGNEVLGDARPAGNLLEFISITNLQSSIVNRKSIAGYGIYPATLWGLFSFRKVFEH